MIWAVVPAKLGKNAKERLAPTLSPELRERLARAMLADVVSALSGSSLVDRTVVISRDHDALAIAEANGGIGLVERTRDGLNPSVIEAVRHCTAGGATGVVIAMGDLPLLRTADVDHAVQSLPDRGVILAASADGTGTNLVAARPAGLFTPAFGLGSLQRHRADLDERSVPTRLQHETGAALDVDTPEDLERLRAAPSQGTATQELLLLARGEARATLGAS